MNSVRVRWLGSLLVFLCFLNTWKYLGLSALPTVLLLCILTSGVSAIAFERLLHFADSLGMMRLPYGYYESMVLGVLCVWSISIVVFTLGARGLLWLTGTDLTVFDESTVTTIFGLLGGAILSYPIFCDSPRM
jgi:hypothetical protein